MRGSGIGRVTMDGFEEFTADKFTDVLEGFTRPGCVKAATLVVEREIRQIGGQPFTSVVEPFENGTHKSLLFSRSLPDLGSFRPNVCAINKRFPAIEETYLFGATELRQL